MRNTASSSPVASSDVTRRVTLSLPRYTYGGYEAFIRSISRTIEVGPGQTVSVSLFSPTRPGAAGQDVLVRIDGEEKKESVPLSITGTRGGHSYGYRKGYSASTVGGTQTLLLVSQQVGRDFQPVWGAPMKPAPGPGPFPARDGPGGPPPVVFPPGGAVFTANAHTVHADVPISAWSRNWLSYSRYDGIIVTRADLEELSGAGAAARACARRCGSTSRRAGRCSLSMAWARRSSRRAGIAAQRQEQGLTILEAGFGQCLVGPDRNFGTWPLGGWGVALESWNTTATPWNRDHNLFDLNRDFPVVDDLGVPVRGLFVLMILFSIVIGPAIWWC